MKKIKINLWAIEVLSCFLTVIKIKTLCSGDKIVENLIKPNIKEAEYWMKEYNSSIKKDLLGNLFDKNIVKKHLSKINKNLKFFKDNKPVWYYQRYLDFISDQFQVYIKIYKDS